MTHLSQATCARIAELGIEIDESWPQYWYNYIRLQSGEGYEWWCQDRKQDGEKPSIMALSVDQILSRNFLVAAFGEDRVLCVYCGEDVDVKKCHGQYFCSCDSEWGRHVDGLYLWEKRGQDILKAYWTSGVEGVEELLLELLKNR